MQERAWKTRRQTLDGVLTIVAQQGLAGVTHRAVARTAGVSLAATTRHFTTKESLVAELSEMLRDDYLADFRRLEASIRRGAAPTVTTLEELALRVARNALTAGRKRAIAWCELMLQGGRSPEGRRRAREWYARIDELWSGIGAALPERQADMPPEMAVDLTVGLQILLHPLRAAPTEIAAVLSGQTHILAYLDGRPTDLPTPPQGGAGTRDQIVEATIGILVREGPQAVTYRAVAELSGLSRSAPAYHFPSLETLLEAAQLALFRRAKDRYREAFHAFNRARIDCEHLVDLTTAISFSETMLHLDENLAFYALWLRAAENDALRTAVLEALTDQQWAWTSALHRARGAPPPARAPLFMQALFVGKLIRAIAAGRDIGTMAHARIHFAAVAHCT